MHGHELWNGHSGNSVSTLLPSDCRAKTISTSLVVESRVILRVTVTVAACCEWRWRPPLVQTDLLLNSLIVRVRRLKAMTAGHDCVSSSVSISIPFGAKSGDETGYQLSLLLLGELRVRVQPGVVNRRHLTLLDRFSRLVDFGVAST